MHRFFNRAGDENVGSESAQKDVWELTAMSISVASSFLKTAFYGCQLIGKDVEQAHDVKYRWANEILKTLGFQLSIRGIPPSEGPCILVGNHVSYLDIPVLMASMPSSTFISKDDLLKWPIIGAGAKAAGTIFVSRKKGTDRSLVRDEIIRHLNEQKSTKIVVFPSGTTTLEETLPWKKGIFEIAQAARVPVKLFNIRYQPIRESAYIDDDNLLVQMRGLSQLDHKSVTLTWMDQFNEIDDPAIFAESLRNKVVKEMASYV
jgi:1-acyl-sn-glycerol-3-phosphate acyltransferase